MNHILSLLPGHLRSLRLPALTGVAGFLLFCGGGGGGGGTSANPTPTPPANTFWVGGTTGGGDYGGGGTPIYAFNPPNLTVAKGTTVTWTWQGPGHSVDSGAGCSSDSQFSSNGLQSTGFSMSHTFNTPGTYPFFCTAHCASNAMKGTITVTQ